jgi:hypothetical protein
VNVYIEEYSIVKVNRQGNQQPTSRIYTEHSTKASIRTTTSPWKKEEELHQQKTS